MSQIASATEIKADLRSKHHEADVVVVGAGVFGCAIAYALAQQGRSVLLLERWMKEPDRIVGELLQPGGIASLKKLGLESCLEGIDAIPCYGYNVLYHGQQAEIPYPSVDPATGEVAYESDMADKNKADKENFGRPEGRAFHHGRFITNLRRACLAEPNITVVETEVTSTITGQDLPQVLGVESSTLDPHTGKKKPDYFFAPLTIVADGYASKFRRQHLGSNPIVRSKFYALELIDCELPLQGYGTVVIGKAPSPVLLYQIGTHETRALIDVPAGLPEAQPAVGGVRGYMKNTVLPNLPPSVRPSFQAALDKDDKIPRSMPNSWLPAARQTDPKGLLVLGDALNMRHPLTGGGMTVAFNDVVVLRDVLCPSRVPTLNDEAVRAATAEFYRRRKSLSSIVNVLAQALYSLFSASGDQRLEALQKGCFGYFRRGFTEGPMGLLGGLIRKPKILAYHFFSVAFLAIGMDASETMNSWGILTLLLFPILILNALLVLWKACVVFLPVLWTELK